MDSLNDLVAKTDLINKLTAQKEELIRRCIADGYTPGKIAKALGVSEASMRMYCKRHNLYNPRIYGRSG